MRIARGHSAFVIALTLASGTAMAVTQTPSPTSSPEDDSALMGVTPGDGMEELDVPATPTPVTSSAAPVPAPVPAAPAPAIAETPSAPAALDPAPAAPVAASASAPAPATESASSGWVNPATPVTPSVPAPATAALPSTETPAGDPIPAADSGVATPEPRPIVVEDLPPANDFAGAPPVPGGRRVMAQGEAPEEYRVETGDTLFDIGDQLLDEPQYWPKLWSLNPEIKNPHFIWPGMKLRFYPGDEMTPPFLEVVAEEDVVPVDKGGLTEQELVAEAVPAANASPVAEEGEPAEELTEDGEMASADEAAIGDTAPPDMPVIGPEGLSSEMGFYEFLGGNFGGGDVDLMVPGFVMRGEPEALGEVVIGQNGENQAGPGESVIIDNAGGLTVGTTYVAVREAGEVENPATSDFVGYRYDLGCTVRVTKDLPDDGQVVGRAGECRGGLRPGDILVPYRSIHARVPVDSSGRGAGGAAVHVVAMEDAGQVHSGAGGFVFLDGEGAQPGSYVEIFQTLGHFAMRSVASQLSASQRQRVATVRVLEVTDGVALGYVTQADQEIRVGDGG